MRKTINTKLFLFASSALICFTTCAVAGNTVSMELIAPAPGPNMAGVYTDPYTALIGAPGQTHATITGVVTSVICDDFQTDVSTQTPPWQATETDLETILTETTTNDVVKFDTSDTVAQQQQDYEVAAYLAIEITNTDQSTSAGQVVAGDLSFALWSVFDPPPDPTGPLSGNFISGTDLAQAETYLAEAKSAVSSGWTPGNYTVDIYTPSYPSALSAAQEFLTVSAPEASTPILLAADMLGLLFLVKFLRKRASQAV
jgi:hypothetical protein